MNVANVPEVYTIEDFWGFLKRNVYEATWQAKNLEELKKIYIYLNVSKISMSRSYKSSLKTQSKE